MKALPALSSVPGLLAEGFSEPVTTARDGSDARGLKLHKPSSTQQSKDKMAYSPYLLFKKNFIHLFRLVN